MRRRFMSMKRYPATPLRPPVPGFSDRSGQTGFAHLRIDHERPPLAAMAATVADIVETCPRPVLVPMHPALEYPKIQDDDRSLLRWPTILLHAHDCRSIHTAVSREVLVSSSMPITINRRLASAHRLRRHFLLAEAVRGLAPWLLRRRRYRGRLSIMVPAAVCLCRLARIRSKMRIPTRHQCTSIP